MRVLVTGATGFIGLSVLNQLVNDDHQILALSRRTIDNIGSKQLEWLIADLSDPSTYYETVVSFVPEVVIHLAWQDIPDFSFDKSCQNLNQSLYLLYTVIKAGACKKIFVAGSCFELNQLKGECLETQAGTPKDDFTWAKHSVRLWLETNCAKYNITLGWFRIFYVYGPGQRLESLIPTILNCLKDGVPPALRAPKNANDFVFVDDVAALFLSAIEREFPSGIYNLGSGIATPVIDVCRIAEQIIKKSDTLICQLEKQSKYSLTDICFWANTTRASKYLGWNPKVSLYEGIEQTWKKMVVS